MFLFTSMSWQFRFHLPPVAFNLVRVKSLLVDKFNEMVYMQSYEYSHVSQGSRMPSSCPKQ